MTVDLLIAFQVIFSKRSVNLLPTHKEVFTWRSFGPTPGDSHLVEPSDLFEKRMPADLAERMPRSVKDSDGEWETVYVDGLEFRRRMPKMPEDPSQIKGLDGSIWNPCSGSQRPAPPAQRPRSGRGMG